VTRLSRLSARAYGRLTPEQQRAIDRLEWSRPDAAARGEAKTVLGWRRTKEETIGYAIVLLDRGLMPSAVATLLGVGDRYLRRLLDEGGNPQNRPRNRSVHAGKRGTNRQRQGDSSS
jgi:hypothetical protein